LPDFAKTIDRCLTNITEKIGRYLTNIAKVLPDRYLYSCSWLAGGWLTDIASRIWRVFMSLAGGVLLGLRT